jgi:hypothetical protein
MCQEGEGFADNAVEVHVMCEEGEGFSDNAVEGKTTQLTE